MTALLTPSLVPIPAPRGTLADLLERLGDISPSRILMTPPPGTATVEHVIELECREDRLCELVEGVLVEKAMSYRESILALAMAGFLRAYVLPRNLGLISGPDGFLRLLAGLVRIPDVAFVSWDRIPGRRVPAEPVPFLAPNLAVEILSDSNTKKEMERKRKEYFSVKVLLVWEIDPDARTVTVYTAPDKFFVLDQKQTLDGGEVLPGFTMPLAELFAELDRQGI